MSYEKNEWQTGDTITATKLNHMEDGIADGGALIVHLDETEGALDKTWQQIHDAVGSRVVFVSITDDDDDVSLELVQEVVIGRDNKYYVMTSKGVSGTEYVADSADGYPVPQNE